MKKTILLLFLLLITACTQTNTVCHKDNCFNVELAQTPEEQATGLMNRNHMDDNTGMLFIFKQENIYSFWMKSTLIPLDIIWINKNHEVVYISRDTPAEKDGKFVNINPEKQALYVLEINAGKSEEIGLKEGDKLELNLIS